MQAWHTLLELKDKHRILGLKGWIYFIIDFPRDLSGEMLYMIGQPTFTGLGVTTGISSFVLHKNEVENLFNICEKTFKEYAEELEAEYWKHNDEPDEPF